MQPTTLAGDPALTDLTTALFSVMRRLRQLQTHDPIDRASVGALLVLSDRGDMRPSEVAAELGLDLSTVSRHFRALGDAGYIARRDDPQDRRACLLTLTADGREILQECRRRRTAVVSRALAGWADDDRRALADLLARLADDLGRHDDQLKPTA
ncbi:MAG: MarR family winged helix-turn-helix transcriptional regulator [Carbonactinosporaceae bacterium]